MLDSLECSSEHKAACLSLTLPVQQKKMAGDKKNRGPQQRSKPIGWRCDKPNELNTGISSRANDAQNLDDFNNLIQNIRTETGTSSSSTGSNMSLSTTTCPSCFA